MAQMSGYPVDTRFRKETVTQTVRLDALRSVSLFEGLSKRNLGLIDKLSFVRTVPAGEVIVAQGDPGNEMMILLDGSASVKRGNRKLRELGGGDVCGEMALLDNQPRSATVTALEPTRLLVVGGPEFRKLLAKVPALSESLLVSLSRRLRAADAKADL
jgi:CRP-like cAMP-binding protein